MSPSGIALCTASRPSPQNISPRALISPHAHGSRRFGWPAHRDPCSERCWNVPLGRIERRITRRGQRKTPDSEALSSVTEILILFLFFWCRDATWPAIEARKMLSAEATEARGVPAEHGRFHRFATYPGVFRRRHPGSSRVSGRRVRSRHPCATLRPTGAPRQGCRLGSTADSPCKPADRGSPALRLDSGDDWTSTRVDFCFCLDHHAVKTSRAGPLTV
jgi:hypothetical protein